MGEVIAWADDTTIAFRPEILYVLQRLAPHGLPPLGAVVLLLAPGCVVDFPESWLHDGPGRDVADVGASAEPPAADKGPPGDGSPKDRTGLPDQGPLDQTLPPDGSSTQVCTVYDVPAGGLTYDWELTDLDGCDPSWVQLQEDGTLLVDGRANVEELEEYYNIVIPREKFDTVGGYLFHLLGSVPSAGEKVVDNGLVMMVEESDERRIGMVRIWRETDATAEE